MDALTLYTYCRSSASFRVRIALAHKNIAYTPRYVNLLRNGGEQHTQDYRQRNPQGLVPLLERGGDELTQSVAIVEWLEETFPEPPLLPRDSWQRAQARALALTIACDIHPLNNLRVLKYLEAELGIEEEPRLAWYRHWIKEGFGALEARLNPADKNCEYCCGNEITLADVFLVPQVYNAKRYQCDLTPFPRIVSIYNACMRLSAFRDSAPEAQADFPRAT